MHTHSLAGVARRAFPAAAIAAMTLACSNADAPVAPARITSMDAGAQFGAPNKGGCARCTSQIAFVSNRDGNLEIYAAADTAGAVAVRLTDSKANELTPAWSPDYKKIAFTSYRDGNAEIYAMNANGTGETRLTSHPGVDAEPVYSPDGKKIAFASNRDGNMEIYVMDADGMNVKRLTVDGGSDTEPTWSPDGSKIAFVSDRLQANYPQLYIMSATDGSGVTRFSPDGLYERSPHWSPDGERIAFIALRSGSNAIVWREVKKQSRTAVVTHEVTSGFNSFGKPTWSRDGQMLAFTSQLAAGQTYVAMDAFDGSAAVLFQGTVVNGYTNMSPAWSR